MSDTTQTNSQIVVPSETYTLPAEYPRINLRDKIPENYDITGIHIEFPYNLSTIVIDIGDKNSIVFDRDMTDYMETFPFYLSLCKDTDITLSFVYDNNWINSNMEYEILDEYTEQDTLGEKVTIWDGYEYRTGEIVLDTKKIPTGEQVYNITKGVDIVSPTIVFDIIQADHTEKTISQKVKQKIDISKMNNDYVKRLFEQFNLTIISGNIGYIDNTILYSNNMASVYYKF